MKKSLILNKLSEYKKFKSRNEFARFLGITSQTMANWFNRNTYDLEILIIKFPEVRPLWLINGVGDMFLETDVNKMNTLCIQNENPVIGIKSGHILPVKMGVAGPSIHDIETGNDLHVISYNESLPDFTFAYKIQTDYLWPAYLPGDWIFITPCPISDVISGKSYFIDTKDHGVMIKRVEIIGDKYILSLPIPKPGYPILTLNKSEINGFWSIVCRVVLADSGFTAVPNYNIDEFLKFANESLLQNHFAWETQNRTLNLLENVINEFINYKKSEK